VKINSRRRGGILIIMIFLAVALTTLCWLWLDLGKASLATQRAQTLSDVSVLSSLRVTAESLETVAQRWSEFGASMGAVSTDGSVALPSSQWASVEKKAADLKKAISGYQGRSTSIIKVVAEANGHSKDSLEVNGSNGSQISLTAQKGIVRDENNQIKNIDGLWYSRKWSMDPKTGARDLMSHHTGQLTVQAREGNTWTLARATRGHLNWDVDLENANVQARGNGGFPKTWADAIENSHLNPNRWAFFRATLEDQ
jgi:hypothetical protein